MPASKPDCPCALQRKAREIPPSLSSGPFSAVRFAEEESRKMGIFRVFRGKSRRDFSAVRTCWRRGRDSNRRYSFEPLNSVVSVGCRKQNAAREFCTKIRPSRFGVGPFSIRHSIDSTERISGDRAAESGHFAKPDQVIGFASDCPPSERSHGRIVLRAEGTTPGADFLIMFDFLA